MIFYNRILYELASFDWQDTVSQRTGKEFSFTYFLELCKKSRRHILTDDEYYDLEISRFKYDINHGNLHKVQLVK